MRKLFAIAAAGFTLFGPAAALAQEPDEAPAAPPGPAITVTIPTCRLGAHDGIEDADAHTAAELTCAEIAHAGAQPEARYRVSLGKLGSVVILSVAREGDTLGSTVDSREMRLQGIEEVSVAAPRIARSIVHGVPLSETEKVDNIVGDEARQPKTKAGKTHFALGLIGLLPPLDHGLGPAPGLVLDVHYETGSGQLELGGSMRFGSGSGDGDPKVGFFIGSLGSRYFTSDTDASPYVGGGLTWSYLNLSLPGEGFQGDNSGLGAFVDAGFEIMRAHHAHLALGVRLDVPFFAVNNHAYQGYAPGYSPGTGVPTQTFQNDFYYAPLSLEMRLTF